MYGRSGREPKYVTQRSVIEGIQVERCEEAPIKRQRLGRAIDEHTIHVKEQASERTACARRLRIRSVSGHTLA
jgi:hypothetical protein